MTTTTSDPAIELREALRTTGLARVRPGAGRRAEATAKEVAGRILAVKPQEVAAVADSPAGPVVTTSDGQAYIVIPEDQPDAEGKTGLAFLRPTASPGTNSGFPVFVPQESQPPIAAPAPELPIAGDPSSLATRADVDRRLDAIAASSDELVSARAKATALDELEAIDLQMQALDNEALVLRNRRPTMARLEAAASEQRDRERRALLDGAQAELLAAAAPIFDRIREAHAELDVLREGAVAAGLGDHWRDRAKLPRGAFGQFAGSSHRGLDLLDAFVEWMRTGESPLRTVVRAPASSAPPPASSAAPAPRVVPTVGPDHAAWAGNASPS